MPQFDSKKTLTKFKSRSRSKGNADRIFYQMFDDAYIVRDESKETFKQFIGSSANRLSNLADNYFLVSLVSCIETFFKNTILSYSDWSESGYDNLLEDKIKLSEAFHLFNKEKVSREFIIANHFSFSNFESINSIFSKLIGKDFYKEIENHQQIIFESEDDKFEPLISTNPFWRSTISEIYEIRNKFIHEGKVTRISQTNYKNYFVTVMAFQDVVSNFLFERSNKLKTKA